jgi:serine/threonine protein kinase
MSETSGQGSRRYPRVGNYQVLSHVATGGMGSIYKAVDVDNGQVVALKLLAPESTGRPRILARFGREARHAARLRHENVVTLYEFGEDHGTYFLALEFVDGVDLQAHIEKSGALKVEDALPLLVQMTRALDHLHRQGLIHRDVKPANFLLTEVEGRPLIKLTDLGLAMDTSGEDFRLTQDGHTVGTIDYMAPEQARDSRAADIRSDIYALGCTAYHMLTGMPPFADGSLSERVYRHAEAPPPDVQHLNPSVPDWLRAVLDRMLAKKPADRYQSPQELLADLALAGRPRRKDPDGSQSAVQLDKPSRGQPSQAATRPGVAPAGSAGSASTASGAQVQAMSSGEQRRIAEGRFRHAQQSLATGHYPYGMGVLLSCCALDPANVLYRQAVREARARRGGEFFGGPLVWVRFVSAWLRFQWAKLRRKQRKVLEHGERLLLFLPGNLGVQIEMAEAAQGLGLLELAVWMLERAREQEEGNIQVNRCLALLFEKQRQLDKAAALWQQVSKADPSDGQAASKVRELAARQTLDAIKARR